MTQPITEQEKSDMRNILSKFYGSQTKNWRISIDTFKVLETLINKTKACGRMMDLVPRPFGGGSVVKWGNNKSVNLSCVSSKAMKAITTLSA